MAMKGGCTSPLAAFELSALLQEDPPPDAVLSVQDQEVKAERWVSPQHLLQQQAEQQAADSMSSRSQQGAALRGVRQMLGEQGALEGAGSEGQTPVLPLELARQPWMDLADSVLTPQQRAVLKEHDKKVQVGCNMHA